MIDIIALGVFLSIVFFICWLCTFMSPPNWGGQNTQ
jgi:hypothetical protein